MAKIDVSKIEGFDTMTPEEKVNALTAFEFDLPAPPVNANAEIDRYKAAVNKANSEAAEYKRQLREKQTEAERAEAERQESEKAMREELEGLRKEKRVSSYTAKLLEQGYGAELATATAEAMESGDFGTVFANMGIFQAEQAKAAEAKALNKTPDLSAGKTPGVDNVEDKGLSAFRKSALGLR